MNKKFTILLASLLLAVGWTMTTLSRAHRRCVFKLRLWLRVNHFLIKIKKEV